jgi:hypothetical protein
MLKGCVLVWLCSFLVPLAAFGDPVWNFDYDGSVLPSTPDWSIYSYYGSESIITEGADTFLRVTSGDGAYQYYTAVNWNADLSTGVTVEVRARVAPGLDYNTHTSLMIAGGSSGYAYVYMYGNAQNINVERKIVLGGATAAEVKVNTAKFNTYRMTIQGTTANLYVDGIFAASVAINPSAVNTMYFGDGSAGASTFADFDYVRGYTGGAVVPTTPDEDPVASGDPTWNISYTGQLDPPSSQWDMYSYYGNLRVPCFDGSDAFLRIQTGGGAYHYYSAKNWNANLATGITVETRARVAPDVNSDAEYYLMVAGDSTSYAYALIFGNGIDTKIERKVQLKGATTADIYLDTTQFHVYRIVILGANATMYIDGIPAASVSVASGAANAFRFGDESSDPVMIGYVDYDYVRAYTGGAVVPTMPDEDVTAPGDPSWNIEYLGQAWPSEDEGTPNEDPLWDMYTYYGSGSLKYDNGDLFLRIASGPQAYQFYRQYNPSKTYVDPRTKNWNADFAVGATVEARMRVAETTYSGEVSSLAVVAADPCSLAYFSVIGKAGDPTHGKVELHGATEIGFDRVVTIPLDTLQWHVYRMTIKDGVAYLYIDGQLDVPAAAVYTFNYAYNVDSAVLYFGDGSASGSGLGDYDYVRAYTGGVLPTPPSDVAFSIPAEGGILPRLSGNQIKIVAAGTIPYIPAIPLLVHKIGTGLDVEADFTYTLATTNVTNDTLVATENGTVLDDNAWYYIESSGLWVRPFDLIIHTLRGDINGSGSVTMADLDILADEWLNVSGDMTSDLNSDDEVSFVDFSIVGMNWLKDALGNPFADVSFTKLPNNPIVSSSLSTDSSNVLHNCVRRKSSSSPYMMWYSGADDGGTRRIHLATSTDGVSFTKQGVVLQESGHAHMPSVIWDAAAGTSGLWKMWYSFSNSVAAIAYATSPDGVTWTKYGQVFGPNSVPDSWDYTSVRDPDVIYDADENLYKMWYWGNNDTTDPGNYGIVGCGYATSPDGINWTRVAQISTNSELLYNEVLKIRDVYYMWYNQGPNIGYAVSLDGIYWERSIDPVFTTKSGTWEAQYLQAPSAVYDAASGKLTLYYNACASYSPEQNSIGAAWTLFSPR